ncbi:MAG TPA: PLP-dependent transferase, partial [Nevskiaceae bacterium]|nr:PLP-dependent transferase [Nevskiaceae bacterium]
MHLETLAIHAGRAPDPHTGDVAPAIHVSSTFQRAEDGSFPSGHSYSRAGNPSRAALEACLAALEGGASACAFASGTAASNAVFQALAPGDHVIYPTDVYHGTR